MLFESFLSNPLKQSYLNKFVLGNSSKRRLNMNALTKTAVILANIGAINWGLAAISPKAELVHYLSMPWLITLVYALVGISGLYCLVKFFMK